MTRGQKIGMRIRKARKGKGLTQLDVALAMGHKASPWVARAEKKGIENPQFLTLLALSRVLDCTIAYLVGEDEITSETDEAA